MSTPPPPAPDDLDGLVLRRARRRSVVQTSAALGAVLLAVGALMIVLACREQDRSLDRELAQVLAAAEDVDDPAPGMVLAWARPGSPGPAEVTPDTGPGRTAVLARALRRSPGRFETTGPDGVPVRVQVAVRADGSRWAVAADLRSLRRARGQLVVALALAELAGLAGAVVAAGLLSRGAVAPLAQALASQRRFVADASHELRAPLTVVHTRAQLLARRVRTEPPDRLAERLTGQLDELVADTRALGEVVEDLLVSAEVEHRRPPGTTVDLARLARAVVASMAAYAESRGVELLVDPATPGAGTNGSGPDGNGSGPDGNGAATGVGAAAMAVPGAETALRRAVTALVDNAIGHVPPGGTVRVAVRRDGRRVHLDVADDGVGLDPADVEQLFQRFAHGTAGAGRRFGLGLALVQHVAQAHGGSVRVAGAPGTGATFTIVLPATGPA